MRHITRKGVMMKKNNMHTLLPQAMEKLAKIEDMDRIPEICCDEYCKYPDRCWQFELKAICDGCKLANLFDLLVDK